MSVVRRIRVQRGARLAALVALLAVVIGGAADGYAKEKKKKGTAAPAPQQRNILEGLDYSKIVWPNPPAITRIKYLNYFSGEKYVPPKQQAKQKSSWMDRLSGVTTGGTAQSEHVRWQLVVPYGVAVDSKKRLYVADSKVRAIFIVNTETGEFDMIKNGSDAHFQWPLGLAIDDADRLFVSDPGMKHILVFNAAHKLESSIAEGLRDPGGMAIDSENRFLYVADAEQDQVLVYDADPPYKLLRRIGTGGQAHKLTSAGDFAKPSNVAVDGEGNVYVSDTWNNRIEIFDADGVFIREFGKHGDGPGYFARPKGIAIDRDGHVWVADGFQNRVQVYTPEGQLLIWIGDKGLLPGQFQGLAGLAIDKDNRVFTCEQYPGRVQFFRYTTDAEARAERDRRDAEIKNKKEAAKGATAKPEDSTVKK